MTKRKDQRTMDLLSSMNQQQMQQFMAANLLAIGVIMKKHGLTEIEISPTDYALLEQGESLEPIPTVEGGMIYRFEKAPLPLAKREVPGFVAGTSEALSTNTTFEPNSRAEYGSAWTPGGKTNAAGWYWARAKNSEDIDKLHFDGKNWQKREGDELVDVPVPFQVRRLADQG